MAQGFFAVSLAAALLAVAAVALRVECCERVKNQQVIPAGHRVVALS
jgi:hypothetical protein